jgi:DNA-binding response OmpR family regulator
VGDLSLSVAERKVMRQGEVIELSGLLFKLLHLLMRESPKPVSKQKITQELWGEEVPDSDSLRSHLYALRKLVDRPFAKPLIQTLSNQRVVIGAYNDESASASQDD